MQTVVEIVNLIRTRALNHRRFQIHLATFEAEYGDVMFYNIVRWLSRGAVLERCVAPLPHIINFLEEIVRPVAKLEISVLRPGRHVWTPEHIAPGTAEAAV